LGQFSNKTKLLLAERLDKTSNPPPKINSTLHHVLIRATGHGWPAMKGQGPYKPEFLSQHYPSDYLTNYKYQEQKKGINKVEKYHNNGIQRSATIIHKTLPVE
jgi:hypothetical protein